MRKPSRLFVRVEPGNSHTISIDSGQIQSTTAFKSSAVRAREFGKAVLFLTTFIICGLVPLSASAAEPVPPQGVSASDGTYLDIIRVTWADVTDETSYEVFRCDTDIDSSCASAAILPADTIQFDDMDDEIIGGNHYYRVKSCIVDICSEYSATDSGYTQLVFESGFEVDSIAITDFDIDGQSSVTLQPGDSATLDWSTSNAQDCVASSSPNLDVWNQTVSISTFGPKTISLSAVTVADTYILDLNCMSALGMETSRQVTLSVTTEPDAPTLDSVLGQDDTAWLFFTANGDGGDPITSFQANCGGFTKNSDASPIVVDGLTNGTEYSCSVIAINANGNSAPSNVMTVTPMTVADAPVLDSVVAGAGSAELTFTPGVGDGGDPVIYFKAYCGVIFNTGQTSPITVSGLTNGTEYSCAVVAVNGAGESQLSNIILATPESVPDAPILDSVLGSDGGAVLLFTATSDGGSAITAYTANCEEFSNTGESSPIAVSDLSNGTEYSCWVIATNANGSSPQSNALTVTPLDSVVIADFQLTTNKGTQPISCGDVNVTLTWAALNESACYGSWRESVENPDGDLTGFTSPDTVLVEDLALDEVFTLRCENSQGSVEAELPLSVKAPCLPTAIRLWNEVFPADWPYPPSYQVTKSIPEPAVYAIMFNTSDIATAGGVGTIEYSSTRGDRLVAISTKPGDFQVADECRQYQFIDGNVLWETEGSNQFPNACRLKANTDYYWNTTFSDGINANSGTCTGTPCITYMKTVTVYRE